MLKKILAAFSVTFVLAVSAAAQDLSKVKIHAIPVTDNLYVLAGGGGNVACLVGDDGVLLVDDCVVELTDKLTAAVKEITDQPIRIVINTHWHYDHSGGNENLHKLGATIIAHENVRKLMSEKQYITGVDTHVEPSPPAALPKITFKDSLTLHWNGEEVEIIHVEPAHTNGDSFVHFRKANILHVGDTWFNGMYTFMDINAGGSIDGLIKAFDRAIELSDDKTKIIPGHGPEANKVDLNEYRKMLITVRDRVQKLVKEGKTRDEVVAAKPTAEFDERWGRTWITPDLWIGLVYDGMKKE